MNKDIPLNQQDEFFLVAVQLLDKIIELDKGDGKGRYAKERLGDFKKEAHRAIDDVEEYLKACKISEALSELIHFNSRSDFLYSDILAAIPNFSIGYTENAEKWGIPKELYENFQTKLAEYEVSVQAYFLSGLNQCCKCSDMPIGYWEKRGK